MTNLRITDINITQALEAKHVLVADLVTISLGCSDSQYTDQTACELNGGQWTDDINLTTFGRDVTVSFSTGVTTAGELAITNSSFLNDLSGWAVTGGWVFGKYFGPNRYRIITQLTQFASDFPIPLAELPTNHLFYDKGKRAWTYAYTLNPTYLDTGDGTFAGAGVGRTDNLYYWYVAQDDGDDYYTYTTAQIGYREDGAVPAYFNDEPGSSPLENVKYTRDIVVPNTGLAMIGPWDTAGTLEQAGLLTIGKKYRMEVDCEILGNNGELTLDSVSSPVSFGKEGAYLIDFIASSTDLTISYANAGADSADLTTAGGAVIRNIKIQELEVGASVTEVTFEATSDLIDIPDVEETLNLEMGTVDLTLAANTNTWLSDIQTKELIGRRVHIWRALMDTSTGEVIGDPVKIYSGSIVGGGAAVTPDQQGAAVTLKLSNQFYMFERLSGFHCNPKSHQAFFPGDTGFKNCSASEFQLKWP